MIKINNKDQFYQSVIAVLVAVSILMLVVYYKAKAELKNSGFEDTQIKYYTFGYDDPIPKKDSVMKSIKIPLPVFSPGKTDTIYVGKDSTDVITNNGDSINIPISQKVYSDSNYVAYVSGFNQSLDSIRFTIPEITKTRIVDNKKKLSVGVIGGLGYGLSSRQVEPFFGVGLSYKLY